MVSSTGAAEAVPGRSVGSRLARVLAACLLLPLLHAALSSAIAAPTPVRLHLKWHHQFQFAGYYAALETGLYRRDGLDVTIVEGTAESDAMKAVLEGRAEFGVGDADVLMMRMKGDPFVVCAAVFQHSPYVLLSRADSGIRTPHDLVGKRLMISHSQGEAQFLAMFRSEGVDVQRIERLPHSWKLADLIEGRVDALTGYRTNEPEVMRMQGVEPAMIAAEDYGVDFYGDTLFTTRDRVLRHGREVRAFTRASMEGWALALQHPERWVDHILGLPGVRERGDTREKLLYEAREMRALILPEVVDIGHMNPGRWRRIADVFAQHGLAPALKGDLPEGFLLPDEDETERLDLARALRIAGGVGSALLGLAGAFVLWNLQMRRTVRSRTAELVEEARRREQAQRELARSEERLRMAQDLGGMGHWSLSAATGEVQWSEKLHRMFHRSVLKGAPTWDEWHAHLALEDAERHRALAARALATGEGYEIDVKVFPEEGGEAWHHLVARPERAEDGTLAGLLGTAQDITGRRRAEDRMRAHLHELERWREVTLGREERILALKHEVNSLLAESGKQPRYGESAPNQTFPQT